jgi:peptide/nickel transport system permease protein
MTAMEPTAGGELVPTASGWLRARQRAGTVFRNPAVLIGTVLSSLFVATGIAGLVVIATPGLHHLYLNQDLLSPLKAPLTAGHVVGTDALGRDLMWRIVAGIGISLAVAAVVTAISLLVGAAVGLLAGYYGGRLDSFLSAIVDITWGFPIILLAIVLAGVFTPGLTVVVLGIALINWAGFARIVRGEALSLRERDFVRAARTMGVPTSKIVLRHLVPNVIAPTLVMGSYYVAITIIAEAGLSFIGVGVQPPLPSLGQIISDGQDYWSVDSWLIIVPGIALVLIVYGLNALGDGLRDLVDPQLRTRG